MFPALLPTYNRADVAFVRGEGSYLFAEDGRRYLDFGAGIAVNAFGHAHPKLVAALTEQAGKLWHTSNLYRVPGQESLAAKLVRGDVSPTRCSSPIRARRRCELAFKMARRYQYANGHPERFHIVSFEGAFHGRTLAGIAAGGNEKYLEGFGPKAGGLRPGRRVRRPQGGRKRRSCPKTAAHDDRADAGRGRHPSRRAGISARLAQALRRAKACC